MLNKLLTKPLHYLVLVCALVFSGCDNRNTETPATDQEIMLPLNFSQWQQVLSQYRGKIIVVDLWASWCVSCIERFPLMVEMSQRYTESPVQFVALNLDEYTDTEALDWSRKFLNKMQQQFPDQALFPNYHLQENLLHAFEQLNLLGIPAVFIYDKTGRERYRLTGDNPNDQFDEKDVEATIQSLLTI